MFGILYAGSFVTGVRSDGSWILDPDAPPLRFSGMAGACETIAQHGYAGYVGRGRVEVVRIVERPQYVAEDLR